MFINDFASVNSNNDNTIARRLYTCRVSQKTSKLFRNNIDVLLESECPRTKLNAKLRKILRGYIHVY
jgi:hypothetical protein